LPALFRCDNFDIEYQYVHIIVKYCRNANLENFTTGAMQHTPLEKRGVAVPLFREGFPEPAFGKVFRLRLFFIAE
jgi:hypothetical protein